MEEAFKNRVMAGLSIVTLIFLISTVASCNKASQQHNGRQKEIAARLDAEEKLEKFLRNQGSIDEKLSKLTQDLDAEKTAHETTKKALLQEQLVNQSLKEELTKVSKLKEMLEENLKEALVTNKASSAPKLKK